MARKRGYVKKYGNSECLHVAITDKDLIELIRTYGEAKDMNAGAVVMHVLNCNMSIQGLVDNLEREKYELLDEDQKIDLILSLQKQLSGGRVLC